MGVGGRPGTAVSRVIVRQHLVVVVVEGCCVEGLQIALRGSVREKTGGLVLDIAVGGQVRNKDVLVVPLQVRVLLRRDRAGGQLVEPLRERLDGVGGRRPPAVDHEGVERRLVEPGQLTGWASRTSTSSRRRLGAANRAP